MTCADSPLRSARPRNSPIPACDTTPRANGLQQWERILLIELAEGLDVGERGLKGGDPGGDRVDRGGGQFDREVLDHALRREGELVGDRLDRRERERPHTERGDPTCEIRAL